MSLKAELAANFDAFTASWKKELPSSIDALESRRDAFLKSYARIASLNAWRNDVLEQKISTESLAFFAEALNDALVSHVFACFGSWRPALVSLRSCIENTCYCLYYADHPVELRLWHSGQHRPAFSEIYSYFERHPDICALRGTQVSGLPRIKAEYATLSRAVHASAQSFRMSPTVHDVALWTPSTASLGKWATRERHVLCALNLLLTSMFRDSLGGTRQPGLRKALAIVIPGSMHAIVRRTLGVAIPSL